MIATLNGEVTQIEEKALVIETGGVGLRILVPKPILLQAHLGETIFLYTHLVVREDSLTLYGFDTQSDRSLFSLVLGVDGVGPRVAMSLMSTLNIESVQRAVFNEQSEILSSVPGVGKKTAQKIILYLQDKLKPTDQLEEIAGLTDADSEVLAALTALGYSVIEAQTAIQAIPKDAGDDIEERLRIALQQFTRK